MAGEIGRHASTDADAIICISEYGKEPHCFLVPLQPRYSSEAAAGSIAANLLVTSNSLPFAVEGI